MQKHETTVSIPILTPNGVEGGRLYYIPADRRLLHQRTRKTRKSLQKALKPLSKASINPDGTGADSGSEEIIKTAEQRVFDLVNYICGTETAEEVFARYKPFAIMSDKHFWLSSVMAALNTVAGEIKGPQKKRG